MLDEILKEKNYLSVLTHSDGRQATAESWGERRKELLELLQRYSYGFTPDCAVSVSGKTLAVDESTRCYAGKVRNEKISVSFTTEHGTTEIPVDLYLPKSAKKPPLFLHLAFRPAPDQYIPVEEITDNGFGVAVVLYKDMVNDNHFGDYGDGIAKHFGTTKDRAPDEWGKIGMWAYGASRVMDYIQAERDDIDKQRIIVIGHSRLGKTALWCGAQDERFYGVVSNDSGYGGAASSKKGSGERITDFLKVGSWDWFCEEWKSFVSSEDEKPYDQSFLSALIAPRYLCVGSAALDRGADPSSEFLTTLHASKAWELLGKSGLICPDRMPQPGDHFSEGCVGYHLRNHAHFLSREDWNAYMKFFSQK